jgi:hypothetical protein
MMVSRLQFQVHLEHLQESSRTHSKKESFIEPDKYREMVDSVFSDFTSKLKQDTDLSA